ncbi:helix-turn-helix domain-containing protein, partial [Mesorhizobium sp. M1C.F.Ca.ET.212.01.1.1]
DLAIGDIAYRCGFENAGHFSRVFRQHTGITPTHLRHPNRVVGVAAKAAVVASQLPPGRLRGRGNGP